MLKKGQSPIERNKNALSRLREMRREFKKDSSAHYADHMAIETKYINPDKAYDINSKIAAYKSRLYREALTPKDP